MDEPSARTADLRPAKDADADAIARIYGHHVLHGLGSFEEVPPDAAEMTTRMAAVAAAGLPWLVAEVDGRVLGYACARPYNLRSAYRFCVEDSIFIAHDACGLGLGRRLLESLIEACEGLCRTQMVAVIGDSGNLASIRLHEAVGFHDVGVLKDLGFKSGRWLDVVLMQRQLAPPSA